ncbi:anhydro-N-acetylmuramic acid kinase [Muricauda sp. SCSIO 64092]|uniref:anhydro-N-acetylmuramic acid kinase n=1 Tax=Allomuricauda sp. SCSIO 64092 TaxID=2908842 RepID=UPI001FF5507E|nr:anhydro-N-acetylmuramic acid kinase [Muricauda sp. SCSIO 64092]UOY07273.1 anhydro-N-acetylmuramic acid kinase [Muricauda sp. SCSIO 64092]
MKTIKVLGMMSGTSLDGLDLAYCHFWGNNGIWDFEIRQCTTVPYEPEWYEKLKNAIHLSEEEHQQLHLDYGIWLGKQAKDFSKGSDLDIDFIASHGHTSHHRPEDGITFQLGNGQELANASGQKVVCDFRTLDVRLGGQGAPLVPIGDELLLSEYDFCLNLGGISNISFQKGGKRIAYDIGLANMPLNYLTEKIGLKYDKGGKLASKGKRRPDLLKKLNSLPYYEALYPKSTGYEWFSSEVKPLIADAKFPTEDLLNTLIHHNCEQIANAIKAEKPKKTSRVLVTGGGALNTYFMDTLQKKLGKACTVVVPPKKFIEYKEAMIFAFMGVLKSIGQINVYASVTGAREDSSSGTVFEPMG